MKSAVVCLFALLASLAVFPGVLASRNLQQSAQAAATGSQAAAATAQAQNVGGQQQASTGAAALGQGSTTLGVSVAAGEVDVCLNGPNENFSICRTRAPSVRSSVCTDVPPDDRFNCTQQAVDFKKCTQPFMFVGSFCLKSCTRCGDTDCNDNDKPTDGSACDASKCDTTEYTTGPACLKTCKRCSTVAAK